MNPSRSFVRLELVQQPDATAFLIEIHDHAASALLNHRHGRVELPPAVAAEGAEDVTGEALRVHPHEHPLAFLHIAEDERNMLTVVDVVSVTDHAPLTVLGGESGIGDAVHQSLVAQAVGDEIGHRNRFQIVPLRELLELGAPGGGAVVVEDLADDAGGI